MRSLVPAARELPSDPATETVEDPATVPAAAGDSRTAPAVDVAAAVAAYGLSRTRHVLPHAPLDPEAWLHARNAVRARRITGFLVQAIADGAFPVTPEQIEEATEDHRASMCGALLLERLLLETVDLLAGAGVDYRVFKGSAFAHVVYLDPSLRSFGDVDVLVTSGRFQDAVDILTAAGFRRHRAQLRPGFDQRFGKGVTLIAPSGYQVDLHRTLVAGRFGLSIDLDDLLADPAGYTLAGRTVLTLNPEVRFLAACYHAGVGDPVPRVLALRDIAQIVLTTSFDQDRALGLARAWRSEAVVARALTLAWQTLQLDPENPLAAWARDYRPTKAEQRAVRAYTTDRSGGVQALLALGSVRGLRDKAAYMRALLVPERDSINRRYSGYLQWWRRGARSLARWGLRR